MTVWQNRIFHGYLAERPYLRDTRETQLFPSYPNSSHSSHVQGTCITSQDVYSRATRKNTSVFNLPWVFTHTLSLSRTTLTNKSDMKYKVHKIEHNYNKIWHVIKANLNIVVNYNFTNIKIYEEFERFFSKLVWK